MKQINNFIIEALKINSKSKINKYTCKPQDRDDLRDIVRRRLEKDENANLNNIDISDINDLSGIFMDLDPHDIHIEEWDVSKVKSMTSLFGSCKNFNCDISKWDTSNVEYMNATFYGCENFDCDISKWDVSKVKRWNICFGGKCKLKDEYKPKFNWKNVK